MPVLPRLVCVSSALACAGFLSACTADSGPVTTGWREHIIDSTLEGADGVDVFDVDADGDMDAVVGWEESGALRLYLNPGGKTVVGPWPAVDSSGGLPVGKIEDARFADLDGDGQLDAIVSAAEKGSERVAAHWLTNAAQPGQSASWVGRDGLSSLSYRYIKLAVGDIDGDGQADLVAGAKQDGKPGGLVWMRSPADAGPENSEAWPTQLIDELEWVDSLLLQDIDGDGWRDILVNHNRFIGWYRNPGEASDSWERRLISQDTGPYFARCAGPQMTLVVGADLSQHRSGDPVLYLVQQLSGDAWRVSPVITEVPVPRDPGTTDYQIKGLACGQLDHNPLPDVAVSISGKGVGVFALMNLDMERGAVSQVMPIATTVRNSYKGIKFDDLLMVDVDNDGDPDLLTTEENGRATGAFGYWRPRGTGVIWYENPMM